MDCEQNITIFPENGEQQIVIDNEWNEAIINMDKECLCVVPIEDRDYNRFYNKPQINGVELIGDKSSKEIHVQHEMDRITEQKIDDILYA